MQKAAVEILDGIDPVFETVLKRLHDLHPAGLARIEDPPPGGQPSWVGLAVEEIAIELCHEGFVGKWPALQEAAVLKVFDPRLPRGPFLFRFPFARGTAQTA